MKTTLLVLTSLAASVVAADISIGIRIGPPPPPRVVYAMPVQLPNSFGSRAIGIRSGTITNGMPATGPVLRMLARIGCGRITTASASFKDTGTAIVAVASMTTIGIAIMAGATSIATTTTIKQAFFLTQGAVYGAEISSPGPA